MNPANIPPNQLARLEMQDEILEALRAQAVARRLAPRGPAEQSSQRPKSDATEAPSPPLIPLSNGGNGGPVRRSEKRIGAAVFHPTVRPRLAVLTVFDDGKTDGEKIRLRDRRFVIGRTAGDLQIPLDEMISATHVKISLKSTKRGWRWVISDLESTNGMFVRVSRTKLVDRSEFLVGKGRYLFEMPQKAQAPPDGSLAQTQLLESSARPGESEPAPQLHPSLTELVNRGVGIRQSLTKSEYWIGKDRTCDIHRVNDPFTDARHLRIYRDSDGWYAQNNKAINGLWLRMNRIVVESACLFQIGEQRFRLQAMDEIE